MSAGLGNRLTVTLEEEEGVKGDFIFNCDRTCREKNRFSGEGEYFVQYTGTLLNK